MALFRLTHNKSLIYLNESHRFGRSSQLVDVVVEQAEASRLHFAVDWTGTHWEICDHSRNGTWINGGRLTTGQRLVLEEGQLISIVDEDFVCFEVINLRPPKALLYLQDNPLESRELERFQGFPSNDSPIATLYCHNDVWTFEKDKISRELAQGDSISWDGSHWTFFQPISEDLTQSVDRVESPVELLNFKFLPSANLETVLLEAGSRDGSKVDLNRRTHNYLLFVLAQLKEKDRKEGVSKSEQGWVDAERFSRMLGLDVSHMNIQVFRARKFLLEKLSGISPDEIVERRSGELRLGFPHFSIEADHSSPRL